MSIRLYAVHLIPQNFSVFCSLIMFSSGLKKRGVGVGLEKSVSNRVIRR